MAPAKKIKLVRSDGSVEPGADQAAGSTPPAAPAPGTAGAPGTAPGQPNLTGYPATPPQAQPGMQSLMAYPVQGAPGQPQAVVIQQGVPVTIAGQQSIIGYIAVPPPQAGMQSLTASPVPAAPTSTPQPAPPLQPVAPPAPRPAPVSPLIAPNPGLNTSPGTPSPPAHRSSTVTRTKAPAAPIGFKKVEVMQAPAASREPERRQADKQSQAARNLLLRLGAAIILLIAGQVMGGLLPVLRLWSSAGEPPAADLAGHVAFLVLVTGLLLWRRNGPTAFASALIFLSAFGAFLLIPLRPALTALGISALTERLPNPGEAASAFCFLMASFGLITRDTAGRRVLAGILAVAGIAAPFTPLASYLPDTSGLFASAGPGPSGTTGGAGPASTAGGAPPETIAAAPAAPSRTASGGGVSTTSATSTTPEFTIELPSGWKSATGGDPAQLLTAMSEDGAVVLSVAKEVVPAQTLFDALAETKLAQARARMARASGMIVGVPGRKDRKRLFIMADKQVLEQLLVLKQETCLTVACQGNHAAIQMHRAELDRIFLTFEPR